MKKIYLARVTVPLLATVMLQGCWLFGDSNDSPAPTPPPAPAPLPEPDPISEEFQGTWVSAGYGLTLSIGKDNAALFQYTSDYCFALNSEEDIDTETISRIVRLTEDPNVLQWFAAIGTETFGPPGNYFDKVESLPSACEQGAIATDGSAASNYNALDYFAMHAQIFEEYYVDFERNDVNWPDVIQTTLPFLDEDSTDEELFIAIASTLQPLADGHNYVKMPNGEEFQTPTKLGLFWRLVQEFAQANDLPFPLNESDMSPAQLAQLEQFIVFHLDNQWQLITQYAEDENDIAYSANNQIRWFKNEGLGYLFIGGMDSYAENTEEDELSFASDTLAAVDAILDEALADLAGVEGMIVDVRINGGGFDYVSMAIASRFAQNEFHAYSKQARDGNGRTELLDVFIEPRGNVTYHGPVVLLTSADTVSAAETFTLIMSEMPQVTLVGEASHGAFSDVLQWNLPNGFEIGMSNEFYLSVDGQWYEGVGVPVDVEVPFYSQEGRLLELDFGIEMAIAILSE